MKNWTKEAVETMLAKHGLFENTSSKNVQIAKTLLLTASNSFYMTIDAVHEIAKFIQQYNQWANKADIAH